MAGLLLAPRPWIDPGMSNFLTNGSDDGHVGIASYGQLTYGRSTRERVLLAFCIRAGYRLLMVLVQDALLFLGPRFPRSATIWAHDVPIRPGLIPDPANG